MLVKKLKYFAAVTGLLTVMLSSVLTAQENEAVIDDVRGRQVHLVGFTLNSDRTVHIKASGAGGEKEINRIHNHSEDRHNMFAYAWILNAQTRKMVWRMTIGNSKDDWWEKWNRICKLDIELKKGEYELYYSAVEPNYFVLNEGFFSFGKIMKKIFEGDQWWEDNIASWKVSVSGVDEVFDTKAVLKYQRAVKGQAIVDLTGIRDDKYVSKSFSLRETARFKIYAIGEGYKGEMYDSAWIIDAATRDKIWEMREYDTEYAGGAIKNRVVRDEITLEPGEYSVYYKTDDSHSASKWNANPPYDPNFWGIILSGADEDFDRSIVEEYTEVTRRPIVKLDRLGDDEDIEQGFTLLKPAKLRIYAIGEGRSGEMYDYGWITDARTGRTVWEMRYRETEHAGGANKNRLFDGIEYFEPGSYIVHFVTDDSHSYEDWNSSRPYDPESWGIKIYPVGKGKISAYVRRYEPEEDRNIILQLIRVGNDEHVKKQFTLKNDSEVRIYAIGEGEWDEMYDYGWIEDFETGRTVWKMRNRETRRAGGSSKNRLFDGTIRLKAGIYIAHYITDDSHAYNDWNAMPPRDKAHWGITIYRYNSEK